MNFLQMPLKLWKKLKKHLRKDRKGIGPGRPCVSNRNVINGIWYVLWSGCQWKSVKKEWFQVLSSTLHERFQTWQQKGVFDKLFKSDGQLLRLQDENWLGMAIVRQKMVPSPMGGAKTDKNPTDRAKSGAKIHHLVDERGAPLASHITGANEYDKWSVDDLVIHIVKKSPNSEQHFCADKGYDSEDIF